MNTSPIPSAIRLEGSEALIQSLDDHIRTCELAKKLAIERDDLASRVTSLRLLYADLQLAQRDRMQMDLVAAGWDEIRASVWRSPQKKVYRGCAKAWHAMRGLVAEDRSSEV